MSHTSAAALRTTYWVFQIGSKLARSACGTKRSTRAPPRCAIAGAASAPAPTTPAAALINVRRSMRTLRRWEEILERAKGFEPSTPTLARLCSTPELRPRSRRSGKDAYHTGGRGAQGGAWRARACAVRASDSILIAMTSPLTAEALFARFDALGIAHRTY